MLREIVDSIRQLGLGLALFLEREAGYHVVSLALIIVGIAMADASQQGQLARDLVLFGLGVLARSMGGKGRPVPGKPGE